jgi:hypothetical protein
MIKKYAKYYIYSPIQEKQYDKSIKSKLFFFKMETSHTYSLEHLSNAVKTYGPTKQTYKNCNTINTDTIERIENCEHSIDKSSEEDDDDDATTVSSVSNNKKTCKLSLPDPLFVEIKEQNYDEPTREYIHNEIINYNLNNRVGDEFYIPSNLYKFIYNFAISSYSNNFYKTIKDNLKDNQLNASLFDTIKSNIDYLLDTIYVIPSNIHLLFIKTFTLLFNDPIWIDKIRDIFIHCFIQRQIMCKYIFTHQPNNEVKITSTKLIDDLQINLQTYNFLEFPEIVLCNIIFKQLFDSSNLKTEDFGNIQNIELNISKLKLLIMKKQHEYKLSQSFILNYSKLNVLNSNASGGSKRKHTVRTRRIAKIKHNIKHTRSVGRRKK